MNVLIISPDYASHYFPLSALGAAWRDAGHGVVVATGPNLAERVRADGFEHRELVLGAGGNPGLIHAEKQPQGEDDHLRAFFEATRQGMVATLRYQADGRLRDLLWRPLAVARRLREILAEVRPRVVLSDQLAFSATVALRGLAHSYVSFVPGHPVSLPGPGELFGFPAVRPEEFATDAEELAALEDLCRRVSRRFTAEFNAALSRINPRAATVADAFAAASPHLTLLNYPEALGAYRRSGLPPGAHFIGSAVRRETAPAELERELAELGRDGRPVVYVSLGSFLSQRSDVLARLVEALRRLSVTAVIASGVTDPAALEPLPEHWLVRPYLPQVAVLRHVDLVICHGGNNTVTEALTAGLPLVVGPFSTDQFAGAADVHRARLGEVFDPNRTTPGEISAVVEKVLTGGHRRRAAALGRTMCADPGPERTRRLCLASPG